MSIIDCHALLGTGRPWWEESAIAGGRNAAASRSVTFSAADVLAACDRAGVERACVHAPSNDRYDAANRAVADACAGFPQRLIGFAVHSPQREAGHLRELLVAEVRSMGLRAVRSDGPPTRELLDLAQELRIPVMYAPNLPPMQGPARFLHHMAELYPEVNFILPHVGKFWPDWATMIEAVDFAKRQSNIYIDTSAVVYLKYLERAARELPANRILFGSCAPHLDARVAVETIRLLELPATDHAKVMGNNISRLLRL